MEITLQDSWPILVLEYRHKLYSSLRFPVHHPPDHGNISDFRFPPLFVSSSSSIKCDILA